MRTVSDCGRFPQLVAGTASRVREPPYLIVPAAVVALTIGKNYTFGSDRDCRATMKTSSEPFIGFKDQGGDQAQTVHFEPIRGWRQGRAIGNLWVWRLHENHPGLRRPHPTS
jgi:hypothetical protein